MFNYDLVPGHMRDGIQRYLENGVPPGHFLTALLSNDLMEAFGRADETNRAAMWDWVVFLYNETPSDSHGSSENFQRWIERGGAQISTAQAAE